MKPSDIVLTSHCCPLTGTLGRVEREVAAALIVRACQVLGDRWQPVTWRQIREVIQADVDDGLEPFSSINRNPFLRPDVHDLVDKGFATLGGDGPLPEAELTEAGLGAIAKWARPAAESASPAPAAKAAEVLPPSPGPDEEDAPPVCPGCYAVGEERCAPDCIDRSIAEKDEEDDDRCVKCGQPDPDGDYYGGYCAACDLREPAEEDILEDGAEQRARDLKPESPERIADYLVPPVAPLLVARAFGEDVAAASRIHALRAHRRRLQADLDAARAELAELRPLLAGWPAMIPRARAVAGLDLATGLLNMEDDLVAEQQPGGLLADVGDDPTTTVEGWLWEEWVSLARRAVGADEPKTEVTGA